MLRQIWLELRRLLPALTVSLLVLLVVAAVFGYHDYQLATAQHPSREQELLAESIAYLEGRLQEPDLETAERKSLQALLLEERQKYAALEQAAQGSAISRGQLEDWAGELEQLWLRGRLGSLTKEYRQWQAYRYLLQHGLALETSWTINAGSLTMAMAVRLPYLLLLPAAWLALQLTLAPMKTPTRHTAFSRLLAGLLGLGLLAAMLLSVTAAAGWLLLGAAGFDYPVLFNLPLAGGGGDFVLLNRTMATGLLAGYGILTSAIFAALAAGAGLLLNNWWLGWLLVGGACYSGRQWEVAVNPLNMLNSGRIWLTASGWRTTAGELGLVTLWAAIGALAVGLLSAQRQGQVHRAVGKRSRDIWRRVFRSVRWRFILLFFLSGGLAVLTVFIALGLALTLYRLGLQRSLLERAYALAGLPLIIGFGISAFIVFFFLLTSRTTVYLEEISEAVGRIAGGDLSVSIPKRFNDELGELAANVNRMAQQLSESLEEERRAEQAKTELITSVSHDLRTPLTSVLGYLQLIEQHSTADAGELHRYALIARQKALRLQKLIDGLFEYTRLAYGGLQPHPQPISLNNLLRQLSEEFVPILRQAEMRQELDLPESRIEVNADGDLLVRVFDNLFANAVRYGSEAGWMRVSLTADAAQAQVRVANRGKPIPPEDLPHIFDRFYRVDKSRNEQGGGAGLGLAIARQIVELHGGTITVVSGAAGTEFTVRLPRVTPAAEDWN